MPPSTSNNSNSGKFFKKISSADPLARNTKPTDDKAYQPPASSKFDFILNTQKKRKNPFTGLNNVPRSILIPVVVIVVLFLFLFISGAINSRRSAWSKQVVDLMARQTEMIRASTVAKQLLQNDSINIDATALASLSSDYSQTASYLKKQHVKVNNKKLAVYASKKTDADFKAAAQSNTIDEVYAQYIYQKLQEYQVALKKTYRVVGPVAKGLLNDYYDSASVMLSGLPAASQTHS